MTGTEDSIYAIKSLQSCVGVSVPMKISKQVSAVCRLSKMALKIRPDPWEINTAVNNSAIVAITIPIVFNLADSVRKMSRVCPSYLRLGRRSNQAGTPEEKLKKKPYRNTMMQADPRMPVGRLLVRSSNVPMIPKMMDTVKILIRRPLFARAAFSLRRS